MITEAADIFVRSWRAVRAFVAALRTGRIAAAAPEQEPAELPASYGRTRLVAMAVDPYTVHAYWEVTAGTLGDARSRLGDHGRTARAVLRFHDPPGSFDVDIDLDAGNWYVPLWAAGRSYVVELGLKDTDGRFAAVVRSSAVHTPRAWPELEIQEQFMRASAERPAQIVPPPAYHKPVPAMAAPAAATMAPPDAGVSSSPRVSPPRPFHILEIRRDYHLHVTLAAIAEERFVAGLSSGEHPERGAGSVQ